MEVGAGYLAHSPSGAVRAFRFDEPVWIIGYKTEIYDSAGDSPKENYLCHTYFGEQRFAQMHSLQTNAIYSDVFTREVRLPQGFGLRVEANEDLHWLPLFNNRTGQPVQVGMRVEITLIRDKDIVKPLLEREGATCKEGPAGFCQGSTATPSVNGLDACAGSRF